MTPADKPDLPDPDYIHTVTDGWKGGTVMHTHYWNADTVLRLLADERRKAQSEIDELYQRLAEAQVERDTARDERDEARRKALESALESVTVATNLEEAADRIRHKIDRKEPTT